MLTGTASPPPLPLQEDEEVVVPTRSPYQEAELQAVDVMRLIREYITQVDQQGTSSDNSPAQRLELHNKIRRAEADLRAFMHEARRLAVLERRVESYGKLQQQSTTTQQLIRAHYGALAGLDRGANQLAFIDEADAEPVADSALDGGGTEPRTHYDIAQDQEFQEFFHETRQNDAQIDAALDRIEFGVQRINDNAQGIRCELDTQETMLKQTEKKTDKNEAHLTGMNRRLLKTINKLGKSRLITYVVLCVILVVLIIVIIFLGKSL